MDDSEPEGNETIVVSLTQTEGGSRILPSSDTVTILILASDNAAGVIGFQTSSRSVMALEGGSLCLVTPLLIFLIYSHYNILSLALSVPA